MVVELMCTVTVTSLLVFTCFLYFSQRLLFFFPKHGLKIFLIHVCGWWVVSFPLAHLFSFPLKACFFWCRTPGWWCLFSAFYRRPSMISWLRCSWKVSSRRCCATKSHTFFPLSAGTFSSRLRYPQSCWNQCVLFIFESMVWFLSQLLPPSLPVSSVTQCLTRCNPMDCSTPGFSVHHQLPEPAQAHVHRVGDAIQPSDLLSSPSPPAFSLRQHQVAKVLQLQHQSFQWILRTELL